ncbi:MAG: 50S ribosome-binding GTPase [Candidatus Micrarchaeota archaeon]|nr:50S ribosome-binding GTPase [Candidatus Micrarchaeota archaeon]
MKINKVTLLGHKDHGKSTLIGNMLITSGAASEQRINEAKKTSRKLGRRFEPGYILDSFEEERQGEMTIDTTRAQVKYRDVAFEFIDVPGHEELIKNMISGASYASFALLIVSAKADEGIRPQTKRHIFLAKMLGIDRIIVAVNKMDTIGYDEKEFERIKGELGEFLGGVGIRNDNVYFVPISAYNAENLSAKSPNMKWYKGKPLLDVMRTVVKSNEEVEDPHLRILLQGTIPHETGSMLIGNVLSGSIRSGQRIMILPEGANATVKDLFVKGSRTKSASTGENVAMLLDKPISREPRGSVIYSEGSRQRPSDEIKATVFLTKEIGEKITVRFNGSNLQGKIAINSLIDTTTGSREAPKSGNYALNAADVNIKLGKKIQAEPFTDSRELGRFVLYEGSKFAGIGIIK